MWVREREGKKQGERDSVCRLDWFLQLKISNKSFKPREYRTQGKLCRVFKWLQKYRKVSENKLVTFKEISSLHGLDLGFLYALFMQWSILATKLNSYPHPPHAIFHILSTQTILLYTQTQWSFRSHTHIYSIVRK